MQVFGFTSLLDRPQAASHPGLLLFRKLYRRYHTLERDLTLALIPSTEETGLLMYLDSRGGGGGLSASTAVPLERLLSQVWTWTTAFTRY